MRPLQQPRIPIYFGGSSPAAYRVGGKHADVFALWGEPLAETAEQIAAVHDAAARRAGRTTPPRISVSFRPILGATEEPAWARAYDIRDRIAGFDGGAGSFTGTRMHDRAPANVGSQRLLAAAERGRAATTARCGPRPPPPPAPPGTPRPSSGPRRRWPPRCSTTSTSASRRCCIRGYDPIDDAIAYGRDLLPLVRDRARPPRPRQA